MKGRYPTLILTAAILISTGCSSTTVSVDFDREADFSSYSAFAWFEKPRNAQRDRQMASPLVDRRIRASIIAALEAKGFEDSSFRNADFLVTYHSSSSNKVVVYHTGYGYHYWRGYHGVRTHARTYKEGTIVVDVIDRHTRQLVWRGIVSGILTRKSISDDAVQQAIDKVLAAFPPS